MAEQRGIEPMPGISWHPRCSKHRFSTKRSFAPNGAPGGIRTHDWPSAKRLFYPLNYRGKSCKAREFILKQILWLFIFLVDNLIPAAFKFRNLRFAFQNIAHCAGRYFVNLKLALNSVHNIRECSFFSICQEVNGCSLHFYRYCSGLFSEGFVCKIRRNYRSSGSFLSNLLLAGGWFGLLVIKQ